MRNNFLHIIKRHHHTAPLKFTDIEKRFKVPAKRFGLYIRSLMMKGEPICLSRTGYFYAREYKHAKPTIEALKYKAAIALKAASAMEKRFELNGQPSLF